MAAITSAVIGVAGLAYSAYSAIDENKKAKDAQKALEGLPTPELTNVAKDLQVSTLGADLRKEESARTTASAIDALRSGGQRTIIGGAGQIQANNDLVNQSISANLDEQQKAIDVMVAQDEQRIQGIKEQRYNNDVEALSSQINSANDAKAQAIGNAFTSASLIASSGAKLPRGKVKEAGGALVGKEVGLVTTPKSTATISAPIYDASQINPFKVGK